MHRFRPVYAVPAVCLWTIVLFGLGSRGLIWPPLARPGDNTAFMQSIARELARDAPPNGAIALIDGGTVLDDAYVSAGDPIDRHTLFQVMSVSKWVTAWVVLRLVESGALHLDRPVSAYLERWRLPVGEHDADLVTVRRLLSHGAGLNQGEFDGFLPDQPMQSLVEFMTRPADGGDLGVTLTHEPGTAFSYSNNGFALLQHLVEEVTGESFAAYADRTVLRPLGMRTATFDTAVATTRDLTAFYDAEGAPSVHRRYAAVAAASLYASIADLEQFVAAHFPARNGASPGRGVLEPRTLQDMQEVHSPPGREFWGLGVAIYRSWQEQPTFGVAGIHADSPAISTDVRVNPATRNGIIVLISGRSVLATRYALEWEYWETGRIDMLLVALRAWKVVLVGAVAIVLLFVVQARRPLATSSQRENQSDAVDV